MDECRANPDAVHRRRHIDAIGAWRTVRADAKQAAEAEAEERKAEAIERGDSTVITQWHGLLSRKVTIGEIARQGRKRGLVSERVTATLDLNDRDASALAIAAGRDRIADPATGELFSATRLQALRFAPEQRAEALKLIESIGFIPRDELAEHRARKAEREAAEQAERERLRRDDEFVDDRKERLNEPAEQRRERAERFHVEAVARRQVA